MLGPFDISSSTSNGEMSDGPGFATGLASKDIDMEDTPYPVSIDPHNPVFQHSNIASQFLNWAMPLYWYYWFLGQSDYTNFVNAQQLAQSQTSVYPERPPMSELLGATQAPEQPRSSYIITPARISEQEWLEESYRVYYFGGSIAQRYACERQHKSVAPHFSRPVLLSQRLHTRALTQRRPVRMIPSRAPALVTPSEAKNLRLLQNERDACQRRLDDELSNRGRRTAALNSSSSYCPPSSPRSSSSSASRQHAESESDSHDSDWASQQGSDSIHPSSSPSSLSRYSSSSASSRPCLEPWASAWDSQDSDSGSQASDSGSQASDSDPDADDTDSESGAAPGEWASWASESDSGSDSGSSSGSYMHPHRLSPPPRRGDRLMRMHQHHASRRPGFAFLQTLMNVVANLCRWPGA
ncbi:hypothetical protein FB451DRAFT_1366796 [Mycena latifolia]|nr:hypothetical protein FB451DRAFT_1366796 [Mycena latifolia]